VVKTGNKNKYKLTNKKSEAITTKYPAHRVIMWIDINAYTHLSEFLCNHDQKIQEDTIINGQITNSTGLRLMA